MPSFGVVDGIYVEAAGFQKKQTKKDKRYLVMTKEAVSHRCKYVRVRESQPCLLAPNEFNKLTSLVNDDSGIFKSWFV